MKRTQAPNKVMAKMGLAMDMLVALVPPSQKKETANSGAAYSRGMSLNSGATGVGAVFSASSTYLTLKLGRVSTMQWR
jgi:hypothetical protein